MSTIIIMRGTPERSVAVEKTDPTTNAKYHATIATTDPAMTRHIISVLWYGGPAAVAHIEGILQRVLSLALEPEHSSLVTKERKKSIVVAP
jgi:hypothetical protein